MTDETAESRGLLLPEGTRLLHVGPHKTGTTSLQAALWAARPAMLAQGVRHVGKTRNPAVAVRAVTQQRSPTSDDAPSPMRYWRDLVGEFRRAKEPRVVLSSELFAWATPEVIERVARDLDASRLHVVVTLRPLGRILPSQWQQNVQAGFKRPYETWLKGLFSPKPNAMGRSFWQLHRHDELVARWAAVLGRDRVTALVVDERDHEMLLRVFTDLLGLREGTLAPEHDLSNRSLTLQEVEAVRAFNVLAAEAGVGRAVHASTMRFGAAIHMKQRAPEPDEPRIDTPQWALDHAREADEGIVEALAGSGVRIVGDLASLARPLVSRGQADAAGPILVPAQVAAEMAMGVALASGLARRAGARSDGTGDAADGSGESPDLARVSTWQLAATVKSRVVAAGTARASRLRRRRAAPQAATGPGPSTASSAIVAPGAAAPSTPAAPAAPVDGLPGRVPDGTRILHIGPPKTGTTSVQSAFWAARASADAQGVHYAGKSRHSARAIWAVTGRPSFDEDRAIPPISLWTELLGEIRSAPQPRVLLSSEGLSYASPEAVTRVLGDLDPARTHVVVTLRPLGRLLASEWQEHVQSGLALSFNAWLHTLFDDPTDRSAISFWRRQRHDRLIERWAEHVGPGNVSAIVVDDREPHHLLRAFEALVGLRPGTLAGDRSPVNRSLTLGEVVAIQAMRTRWAAEGLSMPSFHRFVREKVAAHMKARVPGPDEQRIETPRWALDRAATISREIVAGVAASGVRVVGDLDRLVAVPGGIDGEAAPEPLVAPEIAASMAMGMLVAAGATRGPGGPGSWIEPVETAHILTRHLVRIVARRAARTVTRRGTRSLPG